jgi:hypothetical protein
MGDMRTSCVLSAVLIGAASSLAAFVGTSRADSVPLTLLKPDAAAGAISITYTPNAFAPNLAKFDAKGFTTMITLPNGASIAGPGTFHLQAEIDSQGDAIAASLLVTQTVKSITTTWYESGTFSTSRAPVNPNFVSMSEGTTGTYPVFHFQFKQDSFTGAGVGFVPGAGTLIGVNLNAVNGVSGMPTNQGASFSRGVQFASPSSTADTGVVAPIPNTLLGGSMLLSVVAGAGLVRRANRARTLLTA